MSDDTASAERLAKIEELLSHLQRDLDQLHEALLGQQRQLGELKRFVVTLDDRVQRFAPGDDDFDPVQDKPPHY
jgi:uncharacterized coiled-coil protein SlyX